MGTKGLHSSSDSRQAAQWLENGCRGRLNAAAARILYEHELTRYAHLDGESGAASYQIGDDWIKVEFPGRLYLYNHASAGADHVEKMKALARAGRGLSGYIVRHVREDYAFWLPWPPVPGMRPGHPASHSMARPRR